MFTALWITALAVKGSMNRGLFLGGMMIAIAMDLR
jgi:hypothetical protein